MKKHLLLFFALLASSVGGWAQAPFTFTNWVFDSFTRLEGENATYVTNNPVYLQQKGVAITTTGNLTVTFTYADGDHRLEIYGVDLVNESTGEVAYSKYEHKFAGGNKQGQVYTLENVAEGTYTIRYWSSNYGDNNNYIINGSHNSKGTIAHSGEAAANVTFTNTTFNTKDNASDWKKTGAAIPAAVSDLIKSKGWGQSYNNIHYHNDANLVFSNAALYNINYNYTGADGGGNERLNLRGVEVLDNNGKLVYCDYHEGFTGNQASNRDYKIYIPSAGTYTVRTLVQTQYAGDVRSKGNITYTEINGTQIENEYNTWKATLYSGDVLKIGAPAKSMLDVVESAIASGDVIGIYDAYNAAKTTNKLNLPTGYYYFRSIANDRNEPYLYNNYLLDNNTQHHTLQKNSRVDINSGIWYIENNGTSINIKNGDGQPLVQGNQNQYNNGSVTIRNSLNFGAFNDTKFKEWGNKGIYFTEGLNAANNNTYSVNNSEETRFVTTWSGQSDKKDDNWTFEPVENLNIYNVVVTGAAGYVSYGDEYAFNGGFFNASGTITEENLDVLPIDGYTYQIGVADKTITVNYISKLNNSFIRIIDADNKYMTCENSGNKTKFSETKDIKSIYFYTGSALISLYNGFLASRNSDNKPCGMSAPTAEVEGTLYHIHNSPNNESKYVISFGGDTRFMFKGADAGTYSGPSAATGDGYQFTIEQLTSLPIAINAYGFASVNLPVAIELGVNTTAWYASVVNGSEVTLTKITGTLPANTPAILINKNEKEQEVSYTIATSEATGLAEGTNKFNGTTAAKTTTAGSNYVLSGDGIKKFTGTTLKGFRAYLPVAQGQNIRSMVFEGEDVVTAIEAAEGAIPADGKAYDLNGRSVVRANGVVIVNGKTIAIK